MERKPDVFADFARNFDVLLRVVVGEAHAHRNRRRDERGSLVVVDEIELVGCHFAVAFAENVFNLTADHLCASARVREVEN